MKHLPDNLWKSPVIKNRLIVEANFECRRGMAEKPHYWCLVPQADTGAGTVVLRNYKDSMVDTDPHELQQDFARNVLLELQAQAHHDGLWLVGYTHPPSTYGSITDTDNCWGRLFCIWFDGDGDPQYTIESDADFIDMAKRGEQYWVGMSAQAHEQWKEIYGQKAMKRDMMLRESQTKKAALEALR